MKVINLLLRLAQYRVKRELAKRDARSKALHNALLNIRDKQSINDNEQCNLTSVKCFIDASVEKPL